MSATESLEFHGIFYDDAKSDNSRCCRTFQTLKIQNGG